MTRILLSLLLLFSVKAYSCLNIFAIDSAGRAHYLEHYFFFSTEFKQSFIDKKIKALEKKFTGKKYDFRDVSDYGAYMLMKGEFSYGIDLFRSLVKTHDSIYEIRANLAVAYELNKNIDSAYYWEKKALEINPYAHHNTEWIHVKILEARLKLRTDPFWCLHHNVTNIVDSIRKIYRFEIHEMNDGMFLFYEFISQLNDRFPFTYAEDRVMGKLFLELGDAYQAASVYRAYYCYAIARYLYPDLNGIATQRMLTIKKRYPPDPVESEGQVSDTRISNKEDSQREMRLPREDEVNSFMNDIFNREGFRGAKTKPVPVEKLLHH